MSWAELYRDAAARKTASASASATSNKYAGRCSVCDLNVPPETGRADHVAGRWQVRHTDTAICAKAIKVQALAERGATEGERRAAIHALGRLTLQLR